MNDNLIFFNVTWMHSYRGLRGDFASGGGKHIDDYGWGGEVFNFKPHRGHVYGYVQPMGGTIKLEKLGASEFDNSISGITIVWTAKNPHHGGTFIIGWYKDATLFRNEQPSRPTMQRGIGGGEVGFFCKARVENVTLLAPDARVINVERQKKGWMGQSNVWYADQQPKFKKLVLKYVDGGVIEPPTFPKSWIKDFEKRQLVEKTAVDYVANHFSKLGYSIHSVEAEKVGWDLTAKQGKAILKLEVKGLSGGIVQADLTANEYSHMKEDKKNYRLCVVINALDKEKTELRIFQYSNEHAAWIDEAENVLMIEERTAAKVSSK